MAYVSRAKKKFAEGGLSFELSIDSVLEALAAGFALSESMKDPRYIDAVVDEAFDKADEDFNLGAAAMGRAGKISHMFEWGTIGVNKARSNVRLNPMSPAARLWTNYTEGVGLDRTLWFAYRPSVANVPKPTVADTGMSSEVISKMKDHVFRWKAEVMEEGHDVTIAPKKAKFLLIPAYKENRPYMRPNDIKRGYTLTKGPIHMTPGDSKFAGSFTKFWEGYWNSRGEKLMNTFINEQILSDYEPEFREPRTAKTLRPAGSFSAEAEIAKKTKQVMKRTAARAKARRMNNK